MRESFASLYGRPPTHAVRAPGRVNLIGEHIDYHGLPVMPFAIERAVTVYFAAADEGPGSGRVRIATSARGISADPDTFDLQRPIAPLGDGDWRNYPRAAAHELARLDGAGPRCVRGIDALVSADLPLAAGLSSSSALVVGVGLALARANALEVDRPAFAELMARAERFVGTEGGGMDQAACLLARAGFISLIGFEPLTVDHVPFPAELALLVAASGEVADKSGAARAAYNERRRAGEAALTAVTEAVGMPGAGFRELLAARGEDDLLRAAASALPGGHRDGRRLRARFRHVVTEAGRVGRAREALRAGDGAALGALLTASHASLRDDYEVSTAALDRLVDAALGAGALGARLTGAGFGGSAIALARAGEEEAIAGVLSSAGGSVFAVQPSAGAELRSIEGT